MVQKGVRYLLPERPKGCLAQKVPAPFLNPDAGVLTVGQVFNLPQHGWTGSKPFLQHSFILFGRDYHDR